MEKTKENGITLISLVIAIVVIGIIAGITINSIVGKNGIISNSQKASLKARESNAKETIEFAWNAKMLKIDEIISQAPSNLQSLLVSELNKVTFISKNNLTKVGSGTYEQTEDAVGTRVPFSSTNYWKSDFVEIVDNTPINPDDEVVVVIKGSPETPEDYNYTSGIKPVLEIEKSRILIMN